MSTLLLFIVEKDLAKKSMNQQLKQLNTVYAKDLGFAELLGSFTPYPLINP